MKDLSKFQLIVLGIFLITAVGGIVVVATFKGGGPGDRTFAAPVVLWGTLPAEGVESVIQALKLELGDESFVVSYVEKEASLFEKDLLEAIAIREGPDLIILAHDRILKEKNKITLIPYDSFSERTFKDQYLEEGELYLFPEGILALPFSVDPLVMYWNRDLFASAARASPPQFWDELYTISPLITNRDQAGNIKTSTVALGEFVNVSHAKELLSALIRQAGNPIVAVEGGAIKAVLAETRGRTSSPAEASVRFFNDFSDPVKPFYSWNRSLSPSKEAFIAGDLAVYFGFASEINELREKNPNLNFDVALFPQTRDANLKSTFGKMYGMAVLKSSKNPADAFFAAMAFTGKSGIVQWTQATGLPPVRRDLISVRPTDSFKPVFYDSAVLARAWLDPDPIETQAIFKDMVEGSASGERRISEAVGRAQGELDQLLRQQ